ncbi:glycosyltransferase family 2 protein [Hydrogenovibrio kuenenii]|uniref:glycosyltransferase family 2 protein n=1 Tax=Hydrogenovibrio kuenenii TaxID=63658 RepID=UPI000465176F|nr:glycosyltransferase family 2 protein [Hydrogenovibrio kuenenii]
MKKISIVTACYNEEENVEELIDRVRIVMSTDLSNYDYEHIFIDNASEDNTVALLKEQSQSDGRIKIIVNSRNFGHVRSPSYALLHADGDAVISLVADLQDPPEMLPEFVQKWEEGYDLVLAIKADSEERGLMFKVREAYYKLLFRLSEVPIFKNFTGFGLFDRKVIKALKQMNDPYPFFRGMLAEAGFKVYKLPYAQPMRARGITKNNFYSLYDMGILGIISNSKVPLRLAIFTGAVAAFLSLIIGFIYGVLKLVYWDEMSLGIAPLMILVSFMFSVMLFFIGIIGEYIGAIYTQVLNRPLVFVKERINFDNEE